MESERLEFVHHSMSKHYELAMTVMRALDLERVYVFVNDEQSFKQTHVIDGIRYSTDGDNVALISYSSQSTFSNAERFKQHFRIVHGTDATGVYIFKPPVMPDNII